jgi:hypothetical protein
MLHTSVMQQADSYATRNSSWSTAFDFGQEDSRGWMH